MKAFKIILQTERLTWLAKPVNLLKRLKPYLCIMKVRFNDNGETVEVENETALVDFMRQTAFTRDKDNRAYMLGYAKRAVLEQDQDIRATSEQEFVEDLLKLNHIIIEQ